MSVQVRHIAIDVLLDSDQISGRADDGTGRPKAFQGDGAYGIQAIVAKVVQRRVRSLLAPYGTARNEHGSGLGKTSYVVERTLSWMGNFRRLKLCYERFGAQGGDTSRHQGRTGCQVLTKLLVERANRFGLGCHGMSPE